MGNLEKSLFLSREAPETAIREARAGLAKAQREKQAAEVRAASALGDAYASLSTAVKEVETFRKELLPGAQSAFDAIQEGYRQGKFGYLDLLDAQQTLAEKRI